MATPQAAIAQYERQQQITGVTVAAMSRVWAQAGPEFDSAYASLRPHLLSVLQLGRAAAVHAAYQYTSTVLAETGQDAPASGVIVPGAFIDTEPSGYPVGSTFDSMPVKAKQAVAGGMSVSDALEASRAWMSGVALTMLADTRRDIYEADMVQRPKVTGWVRMLNPPSCPRCVILAGKRFRWNQRFQRHPRCDCLHIPASEALAGDLTTDPYAYFNSMSKEEQDRWFGASNAQAVRDGADIYRVHNIGMRGLGTARSNRRYGTPYKRTVEDIYARDPDRKFVIENLRYHGYITGPQRPGGNILGNDPEARILAGGRGRGTYSVGGQIVKTARASKYDAVVSGRRDPLNRATMTSAERRLYDANYRAMWADAGYKPNSVGPNSADRGLGLRPISQRDADRAREVLRIELARASDPELSPDSVRELARLLGF